NSKIGFGDLILLLRYFFKLKVSTHPIQNKKIEKIYKYQTKEIFLNKTSLRAGFVFRLVRVLI
ncbi:hypothetical protein VXR01_18350, partial [Acinetobacter baumannii]|uniref:hypothetical protein n=1 Tax=Acinetobacter baumannii TaxID=470 RepID=UPI003A882071